MLTVAIAVDSATDYGPTAVRVVAAACEEVIGEQRCPVASDLAPGTVAAWYAVVHPSDRALSSIRIEFRDRTADGVLIEERVLKFSARDSKKSRLASAGSVIAALAAAREGELTRAPQHHEAPAPVAPVAVAPPSAVAAWGLDAAVLAAPAFGNGPYRLGGLARARWDFSTYPFGLLAARYAVHPGNPGFSWWTLSVGVGSRLGERDANFNLEFTGELVFQRTLVRAELAGQRDSAAQNGWGGRVGVDAVWATWRHASLIFGVDGTVVAPAIKVFVGDVDAAHLPLANLGFFLGLRYEP